MRSVAAAFGEAEAAALAAELVLDDGRDPDRAFPFGVLNRID